MISVCVVTCVCARYVPCRPRYGSSKFGHFAKTQNLREKTENVKNKEFSLEAPHQKTISELKLSKTVKEFMTSRHSVQYMAKFVNLYHNSQRKKVN